MQKTTIRKKLVRTSLLVLVPALLVVTLAVAGLNIWVSGRNQAASAARIEASLSAKGRVLATNNAQALVGMAEGNAFLQIQALVASTVQDDPDVVYGTFMMADSSLPWAVAEEGDSLGRLAKADTLRDTSLLWVAAQTTLANRRMVRSGGEVLEFAAPVGIPGDPPLGWIRYGLSTRAMQEAIEADASQARMALFQIIGLLALLGGAALYFSLRKFQTEAARLSRPVQELAAAADIIKGGDYRKPVVVESDDEIGDLAGTFEAMRQTVQSYTEHLEELIAAKMRQVRDILDNVEQGLFVMGFDGTISPEYSKSAPTILGVEKLESLAASLHLMPSQLDDLMGWLALVKAKSATMRWEKLVKVAPIQDMEVTAADGDVRFIRFRYQKMFDSKGDVEKIMVLVSDETEARRIEKVVAEEKERHENEVRTILGLVNNLPEAIHDFFKDTEKRFGDLRDLLESMHKRSVMARDRFPDGPDFHPMADEIARIFRDLHTIKGNSGTYGFESLARLAHRSEDVLEDLKEPISVRTSNTLTSLLELMGKMEAAYEEILHTEKRLAGSGSGGDTLIQVAEGKIEHLERLASALDHVSTHVVGDVDAIRPLLQACRSLRNVPLARLGEKYRTLVQRISEKLEKQVVFHVLPATMEVDPHFLGPVDEALVHMLRNAVDHGIEAPSVRAAAGKPELGSIVMEVSVAEDQVTIMLTDDGNGIDSERVIRKAIEEGLVSPSRVDTLTEDQKLGLIFESGVSTSGVVTDISGRGVGMAAVRDCIEALGGRITLSSRLHEGTQVMIQLPSRFAA
jgi:signal transduction histidine kinase/HAMP domain-containing protein